MTLFKRSVNLLPIYRQDPHWGFIPLNRYKALRRLTFQVIISGTVSEDEGTDAFDTASFLWRYMNGERDHWLTVWLAQGPFRAWQVAFLFITLTSGKRATDRLAPLMVLCSKKGDRPYDDIYHININLPTVKYFMVLPIQW